MQTIIISTKTELQTHAKKQLDSLLSQKAVIYEQAQQDLANITELFNPEEDILLLFSPYCTTGGWDSLNNYLKNHPETKIKHILSPYSAYDLDLSLCSKLGIKYKNNAGANKSSVAQHALSLMLQLLTKIPVLGKSPTMPTGEILGEEFTSLTVGILGFGHVGQTLYELLTGLKMPVKVTNRTQYAKYPKDIFVDFSTLLDQDIIFISVPANTETKKYFGSNFYEKIKGKYLIDISAYDDLYDKNKVIRLANDGQLKGYAFEASNQPADFDKPTGNCLITPHIAWATKQAEEKCYGTWLQNALDILSGQKLEFLN